MKSPIKNWRDTKKINAQLGRVGKIITWTKIYVAPSGFELESHYIVAIVAFANKERMTVQVVDCEDHEVKIGTKVITIIRRIGTVNADDVIEYGIKVKPI